MGRQKTPPPGRFARGLAAEIRAAQGRQRISDMQLAKLIGKSQNYLSKRLRDEAPFTLDDLDLISSQLGISPTTFIEQVERRMREEGRGWPNGSPKG